jgi:tRNA-2-methylthio-N6-dimethylallyladenosine synthase
VRGREQSRNSSDIINEIEVLAENGVKEVSLLGQNVNSYGKNLADRQDFPNLLKKISKINGIERIRFTTSHPKDLSDELIDCFASMEKLCEHIHLPVQSGSDHVLRRMKRGYTIKEYLGKVEKLRCACPSISITSDIIVGFPGESDVDFRKTIELMEKVKFDNTYSFVYSERSGTIAERYDKKVDHDVKIRRLSFLQSVQERHTLEKNRLMLGSVTKILVEGLSKNNQSDVTGRTGTNKIVNVEGSTDEIGKIVPVKITEAYLHSLRGELDDKYISGCLRVVSANE